MPPLYQIAPHGEDASYMISPHGEILTRAEWRKLKKRVDEFFIQVTTNSIKKHNNLVACEEGYCNHKICPNRKKVIATPKQARQRPGYIYAVLCGSQLKIGRAIDLENRFKYYRKTSPHFRLIASAQVADYIEAEKRALAVLGGRPTQLEWFDHTPERESTILEWFNTEAKTPSGN